MIKEVHTPEDIACTVRLAAHIWTEHFTPIIGAGQVSYMLEKFQSFSAIHSQIEAEGYRYFLKVDDDDVHGYLSIKPGRNALFLSKIYLKKASRGRGLGKEMMDFVRGLAMEADLDTIRLTVNRNNRVAIDFYLKYGFERTDAQITDIGSGFVMDDFIMTLTLPNPHV